MRKNKISNKIFSSLALAALTAGGLASCAGDLNEPAPGGGGSGHMLVDLPKVTAYSGDHFWTSPSTRSSEGPRHSEAEVVKFAYAEAPIDRQAETAKIDAFLPEQNVNLYEKVDDDFLYYAKDGDITFELFPIVTHTSYNPNYLGVFYYDELGDRHEVLVWEALNPWDLTRTDYTVYPAVTYSKGVHVTIKKGYKFGFYWGGRHYPVDGNGYNDAETRFYSISALNEDSYVFENGAVNKNRTSRVHAITFELDGHTYLGIEDWADFDFQDLVFSSDTSIPTVDDDDLLPDDEEDARPELPESPEPDVPSQPDDTPDDTPSGPTVQEGVDEVEINLALEEKGGGSLESHLSLHVRSATDVEVFIPVPAKYYCDADDMNIVLDKYEDIVYGGPYVTEINVGGNAVYLHVEFTEGGIRVRTEGVNESVIAYCRERYDDGITFEVWNYFNDPDKVGSLPISMEELKSYLDRATVRFLDKTPGKYVNAFTDLGGKYGEGGSPDGFDFHVTPEEQRGEFGDMTEGPHLNGSAINEIYEKL